MAVVVVLVVSILLTPYGSRCYPAGAGPGILDDGPEVYLGKRGVPTLGGARSSSRCGGQLLSRCVSVVSAGCTPSLIRRSDVSSPQTPELAEVDWGAGRIPL